MTPASIAAASRSNRSAADAKSANESMGEEEIAEALQSNNESSLGAASLLRRKEIEMKQIKKKKAAQSAAAAFLD